MNNLLLIFLVVVLLIAALITLSFLLIIVLNVDRQVIHILLLLRRRNRRHRRRYPVRPLNRLRMDKGEFRNLVRDLRNMDEDTHFKYFRMNKDLFENLLGKIRSELARKNTHIIPITPAERLAITLRILANGDTQQSMLTCASCAMLTQLRKTNLPACGPQKS